MKRRISAPTASASANTFGSIRIEVMLLRMTVSSGLLAPPVLSAAVPWRLGVLPARGVDATMAVVSDRVVPSVGADARAAAAVRTLAEVATRMPKKPASPEHRAPTATDRPIKIELSGRVALAMARSTATTTTKMASTRYSRPRNAMAPSRM